jgi:hypothetical protein
MKFCSLNPIGTDTVIHTFQSATSWTNVDIVVPNDGNTYTNGGMYIIVRKDGPT